MYCTQLPWIQRELLTHIEYTAVDGSYSLGTWPPYWGEHDVQEAPTSET